MNPPIPSEIFERGFRADLVVNDCFIIEFKPVERLASVHSKQLLTYLKLTNCSSTSGKNC